MKPRHQISKQEAVGVFLRSRDRQRRVHGGSSESLRHAFSLVELLMVISLMAAVMTLGVPAFNAINGAGDITKSAYDIKGVLETAATYARANRTYVWVGFFEENETAASSNPASAGIGRLVISMVYSKDGTQIINPTGSGQTIDPGKLAQLGKLVKIDNLHFGDVPDPASPNANGAGTGWDTRPSVVNGGVTYRIGASTPTATSFPFQYPVGSSGLAAQYTFTKTIEFSPQGEAVMNSSLGSRPWLEVGLEPAHGNVVTGGAKNGVALQVAGINPQIRIYRR